MNKSWTLRSAPRVLIISAIGAMAMSVVNFSVAAAQDVKSSARSTSTISATIDGRPGESYEIVTADGSSTAFHILENGDRLPVPLTQKEDGTSEILLGDGDIVEILQNSYGTSQSWSESSNATASSSSYTGMFNSDKTLGFSDLFDRRSANGREGQNRASDHVPNMRTQPQELMRAIGERQQNSLEEMAQLRVEDSDGSTDGNPMQYGERNRYYDYNDRVYSGNESRANRRERMNEMRQRLFDMQGVTNLEELMAGSRTSSMSSAQIQLDSAIRQLEDLRENGNTSSALKEALRDLERAQKAIDKAIVEAGE